MDFCIEAEQLRKALSDIEKAEANGFKHCLAVFYMAKAGPSVTDCLANYSDLVERAHPSDGNFSWGRFQGVTRKNKFVKGKLVPIEPAPIKPA